MEETTAKADDVIESTEGAEGAEGAEHDGPRRPGGAAKLVEEGDIAGDYLEELLDIADIDFDMDIDIENGRASVAILAEGASHRKLQMLVGQGGEVLEALQELTRLAVQAQTGDRTRLLLDVAGYRAGRRATLTALAAEAVERVKTTGEDARLEPMPAFERKVVHDAVAAAGLESESEGQEPNRYVIILAPEAQA